MNGHLDAAQAVMDDVVALRRDLHRHPELGLDNPGTQDRILAALDGLPLEISTGNGCTSVVADLFGAEDGPTVLLRADTDALPMSEDTEVDYRSTVDGRAHACGHAAHTAMLVGAAKVLSTRRDEVKGRVRFMFQPGEEGFAGAKVMIDEGVLDGVNRAFALHVTTNQRVGIASSRPGPMLAGDTSLSVTIRGRGGHASAPYRATDPIPAMAATISALQTAVTREVDTFNPAVVTVAHVVAGTTTNVIPETAFFEGTIRCVSESARAVIKAAVERTCQGVAEAHGCTSEVEMVDGYPVTMNDPGEDARFVAVCRATLGDDAHRELPAPSMGGEDFSYVLQQVPGIMANLGVCPVDEPDPRKAPGLHSNRMRLEEAGMVHGVALHVGMALDDGPVVAD
ncbi:MAG: M20 family metallopeptidase [Actinomycetota bacterium]|nr:M20 family metallopeptidase [Actinomycetota bacterium]